MSRLPFDPSKMAAAGAPRSAPATRSVPERVTVSQLAAMIQGALRESLPPRIRVIGEVSGVRERTHWYFDLKDDGAVINCVLFASAAARSRMTPETGREVVATGRVEFYPKQGRTQFYVEHLEPIGEGALDAAFRKLCDELRALGWFDQARKRSLPRMPRRIAVVTSRSGAALQDVLDTARKRCPAVGIVLADVRVQGEGAAKEIVQTIRRIGRAREASGIDAILLTRGGGSKEDLWTFNERSVAEAIVNSPIPVVAAIGHETDTTIAELVADLRCATPTQAAVHLTPDSTALLEQLDACLARLTVAAQRQIRHETERLRLCLRHPFFSDPGHAVDLARDRLRAARDRLVSCWRHRAAGGTRSLEAAAWRLEKFSPRTVHARRQADAARAQQRLIDAMRLRLETVKPDTLKDRLSRASMLLLDRTTQRLGAAARALELVGPMAVLNRGYSCTLDPDGNAVRSAAQVRPGQRIRTRVADGGFTSVVEGSGTPGPAAKGRADPGRTPTKPDQMDLFGSGG